MQAVNTFPSDLLALQEKKTKQNNTHTHNPTLIYHLAIVQADKNGQILEMEHVSLDDSTLFQEEKKIHERKDLTSNYTKLPEHRCEFLSSFLKIMHHLKKNHLKYLSC